MKRRQRRHVLDINGESSNSPRRRWQSKYEQIAVEHSEENGMQSNPLTTLLEQYNSDSENEDSKPQAKQLDDKVNDFFKEIQMIAPEPPVLGAPGKPNSNVRESRNSSTRVPTNEPSTLWQECFDDSTGYPYYWHVQTNEVTWDVPEEIRQLRDRNQQDSLNRTSYGTQWPNLSSNTYPQPQINIPEGMIPKEVVARNRNRQVSTQQITQPGSQTQVNVSSRPITKDDESDDGKIEMITSFGSDGSGSDTSDNDSPIKKLPKDPQNLSKSKQITPIPKNSVVKKLETTEKVGQIGPSLPSGIVPLIHGPDNSGKIDPDSQTWRKNEKSSRSPPKLSQKSETLSSVPKKSTETTTKLEEKSVVALSGKELKFSLVPGYADDSDVEDEPSPKKSQTEPLFPIVDFPSTTAATIISPDGTVKKVETKYTDSGSVRIFQYHSADSEKTENSDDEVKQTNQEIDSIDAQQSTSTEETRTRTEEETPRPNIFLENLETPSKAFKRKKRIAFDVVVHKNKTPEVDNITISKPEPVLSPPAMFSGNEADRHGFGFPKESRILEIEDSVDVSDGKSNTPTLDKGISKGTISFVKGETMLQKSEEINKEKIEAEIKALKAITDVIMEKLKFLSEGGQPASAVQIMAIQLQTLLAAWEAGELKNNYLNNWLTETGRELSRLEEAAAPPGWNCQWDRSHKRYFYRNSTSGDAQWTYPEADVIGGSVEMELCTTPPPQGQEEPCIIESQMDKLQEVPTNLFIEKDYTADDAHGNTNDLSAPPPPQISSPSPPPPPRIYPEDMRKGKNKRRGSSETNFSQPKKDKLSIDTTVNSTSNLKETVNPPLPPSPTKSAQPPLPPPLPTVTNPSNSEPLPPGVDPPEMPFTIAAPNIETTMLYTTTGPQSNPIYAATIADPTMLSHHTALMQGQLLHYPTYHQHLHNQALIAAASRLTGQEAVQFMVDYGQVYANTQVIAKPPVKTHKESLGSVLDSFYNDIATMEKIEQEPEQVSPVESAPLALQQIAQEVEQPPILTDSVLKERKKKKMKLGISKKQKEVSSMVAKWQKAQHYEDNN